MSAFSALRTALIALFRGDATLTGLVPGGVHTGSAPQGTTGRYLVLSNPTQQPGVEAFGGYGSDATIQLDAFGADGERTDAGVDQVLDRCETLLRTPLTLTGHTPTIGKQEFRTVLVEGDETRHGIARWRFVTAEAA